MKIGQKNFMMNLERRNRWIVATAALLMAWPAWWYCRGGSQGLFIMTLVLAGIAVLLPFALPRLTRWVVWSWVGVTVILFASNVARLMPPEQATFYYEHIMDRLITAFYAVGVTSLFFRLSTTGVSTIIISVLPMLMLTLSRSEGNAEWLSGQWNIPLVGFVLLAVTLDQVSQLLRKPEAGQLPAPFWREMVWRYGLFAVMVVLVFTLRKPIEQSVVFVQKQVLGLVTRTLRSNSRDTELSLSRSFPKDFGHRTRILMVIQGKDPPGYLREVAYTNYQKGSWALSKQTKSLLLDPASDPMVKRGNYRLLPDQMVNLLSNKVLQVEVLTPHLLNGLPLPGHAQMITIDKRDYSTDDNGIVSSENILPERYEVWFPLQRVANKAFPLPLETELDAYLAIPSALTNAVQKWITQCDGFGEIEKPILAARHLERYFQHHFTYNLEFRAKGRADPLIYFMEQREGFCIHFASAAALMLRGRGIPTRVVSGFASFGYDSWLMRWVVRERERHAWIELWDETEQQWFMLDPTPLAGRPSAHDGVSILRRAIDCLGATWKRFIYWLTSANFLLVIAEAGIWAFELIVHFLRTPLGWSVITLAGIGIWWRRRSRLLRLSPEERYKRLLAKRMQRTIRRRIPAALQRIDSESWDAWLIRIKGKIPEQTYQEVAVDVESYQQLRYRTHRP
jgi:Transglutaminase-like superfamily